MSQPFLVIPHYTQTADGQCLPACVRMLLAHSGILMSETEVAEVLEAKPHGAPSFAIKKLHKLGFLVDYREWSVAEVGAALAGDKPVIVFVRTGFREDTPISVSWDGLLAAWGEFGYRGATINKK